MKLALKKVLEINNEMVHFVPDPIADAVTLCGITDWLLGDKPGKSTSKAVTCNHCKSIVSYCQSTRKETFK